MKGGQVISELTGIPEIEAELLGILLLFVFVGLCIWAVCDAGSKALTEFAKALGEYHHGPRDKPKPEDKK